MHPQIYCSIRESKLFSVHNLPSILYHTSAKSTTDFCGKIRTQFWFCYKNEESPANPLDLLDSLAETVGFEPTVPWGTTDFESVPLWPLRYVSEYINLNITGQQLFSFLRIPVRTRPISQPQTPQIPSVFKASRPLAFHSPHRISSQSRYDHFDTSPNISTWISQVNSYLIILRISIRTRPNLCLPNSKIPSVFRASQPLRFHSTRKISSVAP